MKNRPFYVIAFMVALAAVFGAGVTGIYLGSQGTLEQNQAFLRERSLVEAFSLGDPETLSKSRVIELVSERIDRSEVIRDPETGWQTTLIKAYGGSDGERELLGYGFAFRGVGFWAPIEGILAVTPDLETTMGITIVNQSETPGLGGRITEAIFTGQFRKGIRVTPNDQGEVVRVAAAGSDQGPRHIDAITGATQTSMAMERILNDALVRFHRAMQARETDRRG